MTERHKRSNYCWKSGAHRLVQCRIAANLYLVKMQYLQSAVRRGRPVNVGRQSPQCAGGGPDRPEFESQPGHWTATCSWESDRALVGLSFSSIK